MVVRTSCGIGGGGDFGSRECELSETLRVRVVGRRKAGAGMLSEARVLGGNIEMAGDLLVGELETIDPATECKLGAPSTGRVTATIFFGADEPCSKGLATGKLAPLGEGGI